ncbi:capsular biosynthesis protein [Enterococcus sp. JM4C]|uniref:DegT/DnrJ/EryC1/StrS family aminotransferase n=1 Tax=Candidatus Enterococcus huntleyi TaxID=1857217 RepID=UPI00137B06D9|nr:DegT/DnrJ/EryC1/StrS family aminotransferase [Enterococcus sp. JM4C]KAF1298826.1 capsular biosynthesis protein [Enterococcus sp. JM4C]
MKSIPFSPPDMSDKEVANVMEVLKSGWLTTGPKTKQFEKEIATYCRTERAVCLNSATACMESTLRLLGIGEGDEVITSAYTYTASASVIEHVGAKIVLVDTAPNSFEMDYTKLENAITEKTKAIIPVDLAGIMCDYEKIFEIVNRNKKIFKSKNEIQNIYNRIVVIADAAHSFGAKQKDKMSGEVADFTCFSFHAVKNLTTVEGGAVTWTHKDGLDDEEVYRNFMLLSLHGQSKDALAKSALGSWEYDIQILGYKCNMTDLQATIGLAQLDRYNKLLSRRKEIINFYNENLDNQLIAHLPHYTSNSVSSGHLYMVNLKGKTLSQRNQFIEKMAKSGIACNVHYKPLPMLTAYKNIGFSIEEYPNAYQMFSNEVTLPLHTLLSQEDLEYIVEFANKYVK